MSLEKKNNFTILLKIIPLKCIDKYAQKLRSNSICKLTTIQFDFISTPVSEPCTDNLNFEWLWCPS